MITSRGQGWVGAVLAFKNESTDERKDLICGHSLSLYIASKFGGFVRVVNVNVFLR